MDAILTLIIERFNLDSTEVLALLAILMFVFRAIGNYIPDNATGFWGFVRKVSKVLGLYVANRVTKELDVNEAAVAAVELHELNISDGK